MEEEENRERLDAAGRTTVRNNSETAVVVVELPEPRDIMEYYAIYLPYKEPELSIKSFYNDKEEALKVLKSHKEARLKAFRTSEEAIYFYLNGPSEPVQSNSSSNSGSTTMTTGNGGNGNGGANSPGLMGPPKSPLSSTAAKLKLEKTPFKAPKSQELVAFRKNIEKNELDMVRNIIQLNPRYLVSSGDMPTILKEGPRYNALHVAAMEGNADMCRLILGTIENSSFIEFLHGQRNASTDEVSAILLDLYLNMPDKCRSETPLHFAAKFGSVGVIEVLIGYPQCKMTKNSDGNLPKDIICQRAKSKNDTPEIRRAIAELLQERFFVPVLRAIDNSTPPVIGDPFTLANPPNLEARDRFSPKLEIKAYAGPMDREKAAVFAKRWKTPPRLIPSPKGPLFISPVKALSSSKIPVCVGAGSPLSSTPIAKTGRRTLFPNRSLELSLDDGGLQQEEDQRNNSINNNFEIEVVKEDADLEALEEQEIEQKKDEEDQKNGNSIKGVRPLPKTSVVSNFLFRKYREPPLQNSFATIYDDDDEVDEVGVTRNDNEPKELDQPKSPLPVQSTKSLNSGSVTGTDNGSFSYFCDGNNSFYEGTNITESPSFKERKLRLTDTEKGLEIIGRNLAEDHEVGWNEYWKFLGTFADLKSGDGLRLLEDFLRKRQHQLELDEQEAEFAKNFKQQPVLPVRTLPTAAGNDSLGSICDALDKMRLGEMAGTPQIQNYRKRPVPAPLELLPIRSKITNPYLCLHNSLQVFAKRFVKNLDDTISTTMTMDFAAFFQQAVVDCVRKLNTLVDNYRKDAAFEAIDFTKVHSRYAQLIVINIELYRDTAPGVIHRLKVLLDKSREVNSARKHPDLHDSLVCLQNFLDFYIYKKAALATPPEQQTEASCSLTWREDPLVHSCNCRIDGGYAKKGSMERLNKRREQRKKVAAITQQQQDQMATSPKAISAGFETYRDSSTRNSVLPVLRMGQLSDDDDDDEEYFSCSDSELDSEDDDPNVSFGTPPSSPSFFSQSSTSTDSAKAVSTDDGVVSGIENDDDDDDGDGLRSDCQKELFLDTSSNQGDDEQEESPVFRNYIEGDAPSKQDVDVLNVLEKRTIDPAEFPHVNEWRKAMLRLSPVQRESLSTKMNRSRWRRFHNDSTALGEQLNTTAGGAEKEPSSPPTTPVTSVSPRIFRFGNRRPDLMANNNNNNDSLGSLDGRLSLMNISDYATGKHHHHPGAQHHHSHQRATPAPSS